MNNFKEKRSTTVSINRPQKHFNTQPSQNESVFSHQFKLPEINYKQTISILDQSQCKQKSPLLSDNFATFQFTYDEKANNTTNEERDKLELKFDNQNGILSKYIKLKQQEQQRQDLNSTRNSFTTNIHTTLKTKHYFRKRQQTLNQEYHNNDVQKIQYAETFETESSLANDTLNYQIQTSDQNNQILLNSRRRNTLIGEGINQQELYKRCQTISIKKKMIENEYKKQLSVKKFKKIYFVIKAFLRISYKYRQQQKQIKAQCDALQSLREPHIKQLITFSNLNVKKEYNQFIQQLCNKIIYYFHSDNYLQEVKQQHLFKSNILNKDVKKTRFCSLSKLLFQNLEMLTRKGNLPQIIFHSINNCIFKQKNTETSHFLFKKCQYYQLKTVLSIPKEQKLMIATDYLIFQVLIPYIIQLANDFLTYNEAHQQLTLFHCVGMASLIQYCYVQKFQNMRNVKNPNGTLTSKKLIVEQELKKIIKVKVENTDEIPETNQIFIGSFTYEVFDNLFLEKNKWEKEIKALFNQTIKNLLEQIDV